ncbi:MAG: hypothetical protein ACJ76B_04160 [Solirubrobacterales bacterium]
MTGRQAIVTYLVSAVVVELLALAWMKHLGTDSQTIGAVYALFLSAVSLGGGFIFNRYY